MQPVEPVGAFFQWGDGAGEWLYFDAASGNFFQRLWILASGGAGTEEAEFPCNHGLQGEFTTRGKISYLSTIHLG